MGGPLSGAAAVPRAGSLAINGDQIVPLGRQVFASDSEDVVLSDGADAAEIAFAGTLDNGLVVRRVYRFSYGRYDFEVETSVEGLSPRASNALLQQWGPGLVQLGGEEVRRGQTVLTLGTGGVSIFALQIAKALGARVIITSSSHEKLERARALGADVGIHRIENPAWDKAVREATGGEGADLVVENGGAGTLNQSIRATAAGGTVAMLGALTGLEAPVQFAPVVMRRIRIAGIMTDCRRALRDVVDFLEKQDLRPVLDLDYPLAELPAALDCMERGAHFGKIIIRIA